MGRSYELFPTPAVTVHCQPGSRRPLVTAQVRRRHLSDPSVRAFRARACPRACVLHTSPGHPGTGAVSARSRLAPAALCLLCRAHRARWPARTSGPDATRSPWCGVRARAPPAAPRVPINHAAQTAQTRAGGVSVTAGDGAGNRRALIGPSYRAGPAAACRVLPIDRVGQGPRVSAGRAGLTATSIAAQTHADGRTGSEAWPLITAPAAE